MGRKSAKGKERKQKRKEESAKMAVSLAKVEAANKIEDPLSLLEPFKKYERNGVSLAIEFKRCSDMDEDTKEFVFQLCKKNMQKLYESYGMHGWKEREKRDELNEDRAMYLIARNSEQEPVAFVHFRFEMEFEEEVLYWYERCSTNGWSDRRKREEMLEDKAMYLIVRNAQREPSAFVHFRFDTEFDEEVLYCYEIQLTESLRRKGLGKFLMQILELMAYKTEMLKVMLTVFKSNDSAVAFFMEALKFEVDDISPEDGMYEDEAQYWILSKTIKRKTVAQKPAARANGTETTVNGHAHTNGCCHGH